MLPIFDELILSTGFALRCKFHAHLTHLTHLSLTSTDKAGFNGDMRFLKKISDDRVANRQRSSRTPGPNGLKACGRPSVRRAAFPCRRAKPMASGCPRQQERTRPACRLGRPAQDTRWAGCPTAPARCRRSCSQTHATPQPEIFPAWCHAVPVSAAAEDCRPPEPGEIIPIMPVAIPPMSSQDLRFHSFPLC